MNGADQFLEKLTAEERSSLMLMGIGPLRRLVVGGREERLMELGLTELVCGAPELTSAGRRAAVLLGAPRS